MADLATAVSRVIRESTGQDVDPDLIGETGMLLGVNSDLATHLSVLVLVDAEQLGVSPEAICRQKLAATPQARHIPQQDLSEIFAAASV